MAFLNWDQSQARKPYAEVLPDGRKRLTRYFYVPTTGFVPPGLDYAPGTADAWTDAPSGWTGLLLTYKKFEDELNQPGKDTRPVLTMVFEQISRTGETQTGGTGQTQLPDDRQQVVFTYVMFSDSTYTPQVPGVTTAPSPFTSYYLWQEETDDDGTLRSIKRTYQTAGTTFTDDQTLSGGAIKVRKITSFKTVPATPTGYTLIGTPTQNPNGYPVYTYTFVTGTTAGGAGGLVTDETTISNSGALVVYHRVAIGAAPTTPSATIGGTVTLFESSLKHDDGYDVYDYRWAEGDGQASITTTGESDGALVYTVTDYAAGATTPAYPGSGTAYLITLQQRPENGYYVNTATYKKPPATQTFKKMYEFLMPGLASFSGAPVLFNQSPPVTMHILASVEVSYATSQVTTTPFTVSSYAKMNTQWIPYTNPGASPTPGSPPADTTTGPPQGYSESLGGYLAGASGISDTNQYFNGVFVSTYTVTLSSSTPSTRPTGSTTLAVDNDPYIVDTSGNVVYRRMVTTYSF